MIIDIQPLLLGLVILTAIAASIGWFIVRMRDGDSVIDIWKYFIIMIIWSTIFIILYLVLAKYIMG